jgi:phosphatidylglycerophosphatase A
MAAGSPPSRPERVGAQPAGPWAWLVATCFGVGRLPLAPGTWGSAATVLVWWLVSHWVRDSWQIGTLIGLVVVITLVGIPAATRVERQTGCRDPQLVVIDEVAGQLIALVAVPVFWKTFLTGFILFRVFDTLKPPPLRQLEKLPEGIGIVMDDIGAGLYALAIMQALLKAGVWK